MPSLAPALICGITDNPGQLLPVAAVTAFHTTGLMGLWYTGLGSFITEILIFGSASTWLSVRSTSSARSTGSSRQLTTAVALWGSAFSGWPPESMVATHVVRS